MRLKILRVSFLVAVLNLLGTQSVSLSAAECHPASKAGEVQLMSLMPDHTGAGCQAGPDGCFFRY